MIKMWNYFFIGMYHIKKATKMHKEDKEIGLLHYEIAKIYYNRHDEIYKNIHGKYPKRDYPKRSKSAL